MLISTSVNPEFASAAVPLMAVVAPHSEVLYVVLSIVTIEVGATKSIMTPFAVAAEE